MMINDGSSAPEGRYIAVESGTSSIEDPPSTYGCSRIYHYSQGWCILKNDSGRIQWNNIAGGANWHWDVIHSNDDSDAEVE